jgi:isopentenyl-diphosphate delta-isomerase
MTKKINVVDDNGKIIGEETREVIHRDGLLHREIHVWFYTPNKEIIFQHRAKDKDTYPDKLDATVGGHVEIGDDYIEAAVREVEEETGIRVENTDLKLGLIVKRKSFDKDTGRINNAIKAEFSYCYNGLVSSLKVEEGKAIGFELWSSDKFFNLSSEEREKFIPSVFDTEIVNFLKETIK